MTHDQRPLLLYITDAERLGGAEAYLETLLLHADRTRYQVGLALPPRAATKPLVARALAVGVKVAPLDVVHTDAIDSRSLARSLLLLQQLRPQVVHFVLNGPRRCAETVLASRLLGVARRLATFQLVTPIPPFRGLVGVARTLNRRLQFRTLHHGIAVSHGNRRLLIEQYGFPENGLSLIPNSVDQVFFSPRHDTQHLRAEWEIPADALLLGVVGRLSPQKGQRVLLEALPDVWRHVPNTYVVLVGAGELEAELQAQAARIDSNNRIRFVGWQPRTRMPDVLAALDLFVLPSLYEGLPFAVLEAMAMARPIVATSVDGTTEAITHGRDGVLVPPNDSSALAASIVDVLTNAELRVELGVEARRTVEQRFDQQAMLRETYRLYL